MEYFTKVKVALDYIENRVKENPKDVEVANEVCFSLPHFRSIFRTTVGQGLSAYIRQRRLFHAAFRLQNSEDSVLNIALDYGFGSHEAFTRAFAKLFGKTPRQFRVDHRKNVRPPEQRLQTRSSRLGRWLQNVRPPPCVADRCALPVWLSRIHHNLTWRSPVTSMFQA